MKILLTTALSLLSLNTFAAATCQEACQNQNSAGLAVGIFMMAACATMGLAYHISDIKQYLWARKNKN